MENKIKKEEKICIEIEGKTIKEAIEKGLQKIKLPRNKIKIEILQEEKRGLFKLPGVKPAKIRIIQIE